MEKIRGFEVVTKYEGQVNLPARATFGAAGYDFESAEDVVIPSIWKLGVGSALKAVFNKEKFVADEAMQKQIKPTLIPTGIKAYMGSEEYLQLTNRSSNPLKNYIWLANGVGVIDSDYYGNADNEGHIMFQFLNFGLMDKKINKGDRIGQGIFLPFLKADQDSANGERTGGFGSSGQR